MKHQLYYVKPTVEGSYKRLFRAILAQAVVDKQIIGKQKKMRAEGKKIKYNSILHTEEALKEFIDSDFCTSLCCITCVDHNAFRAFFKE